MERSTLTPNYVFNVLRVRYSSGGVPRVSRMRMYDCASPCILLLPRFSALVFMKANVYAKISDIASAIFNKIPARIIGKCIIRTISNGCTNYKSRSFLLAKFFLGKFFLANRIIDTNSASLQINVHPVAMMMNRLYRMTVCSCICAILLVNTAR